jgi:hypothetical protein
LFLLVKVAGIMQSVGKLGKIGPGNLSQISKPTYIYWWAHKVESSKHIVVRSAGTSGGFWETTKS